jgi:hypothetical protein
MRGAESSGESVIITIAASDTPTAAKKIESNANKPLLSGIMHRIALASASHTNASFQEEPHCNA